ncbi:MAG: GTP-binding protein [Caldilineaceae bacterium]
MKQNTSAGLVRRDDMRNVAIIAHVDHGKTTLVDGMLRQTNVFHAKQQVNERVLDSNDLERERGITILAKNTGIEHKGTTINIVDTPGHADFGGEVERIMNMVDGVLLLVDAVEGPCPRPASCCASIGKGYKVILVVNKIDRPAARRTGGGRHVRSLHRLGRQRRAGRVPGDHTRALDGHAGHSPDARRRPTPLFDTILEHLPASLVDPAGPTQMLVTTIEYSSYVGKIAIGRLRSGRIRTGQSIVQITPEGEMLPGKVTQAYTFRNLQRQPEDEVEAGNIIAVAGIPDVGIGDTLADPNDPRPLPPITVEEPTVRMTFSINDSPFAGREGKYVTSRQLRQRLMDELERNVALRVSDTGSASRVAGGRATASCIWPSSSRPCAARATSSRSAAPRSSSARRKRRLGTHGAGLC